nr:unnamed protein product [Digitaria exilis]
MPPKASTKRWVPVNRAASASESHGRGEGHPATGRVSLHPGAPLQQRVAPKKDTKQWVPVNRPGASHRSGGCDRDADRLSALPDALLHHIMSFLKAWEVVRTCVLSRRWRHLWESVACIDLRVGQGDYDETPEDFPEFVRQLACRREASAPVDTIRVRSSNVDDAYDEEDSKLWIRAAIKRGARVIHIVGHRNGLASLEHTAFVSCHLKILKLSYALLDDKILRQLSLILTMFKCQINVNLCIAAQNLVLLRCISPITQAPSFKNIGSLVTGTVILDDYSFTDDFEDFSKDELDETTDDDESNDSNRKYMNRYGFGVPQKEWISYKDGHDYGSDFDSDDCTYEYSEIANDGFSGDGNNSSNDVNRPAYSENSGHNGNKILGGHNILQSLANATNLELLADAGEVILNRELKRCPTFSNLKTLTLGEWCMGADFDALIFLLQHSPKLERLFVELKLNFNTRKQVESSVKPKGRSFICKHLRMVKIKCSKDDVRVHKVAHLFTANGVPVKKIFVRRTGSTRESHFLFKYLNSHSYAMPIIYYCVVNLSIKDLRSEKIMKDLARHELEFWGNDEL